MVERRRRRRKQKSKEENGEKGDGPFAAAIAEHGWGESKSIEAIARFLGEEQVEYLEQIALSCILFWNG